MMMIKVASVVVVVVVVVVVFDAVVHLDNDDDDDSNKNHDNHKFLKDMFSIDWWKDKVFVLVRQEESVHCHDGCGCSKYSSSQRHHYYSITELLLLSSSIVQCYYIGEESNATKNLPYSSFELRLCNDDHRMVTTTTTRNSTNNNNHKEFRTIPKVAHSIPQQQQQPKGILIITGHRRRFDNFMYNIATTPNQFLDYFGGWWSWMDHLRRNDDFIPSQQGLLLVETTYINNNNDTNDNDCYLNTIMGIVVLILYHHYQWMVSCMAYMGRYCSNYWSNVKSSTTTWDHQQFVVDDIFFRKYGCINKNQYVQYQKQRYSKPNITTTGTRHDCLTTTEVSCTRKEKSSSYRPVVGKNRYKVVITNHQNSTIPWFGRLYLVLLIGMTSTMVSSVRGQQHAGGYVHHGTNGIIIPSNRIDTVARQWMEVLLYAIRIDLARPTVHARNLYHASVAMYDAYVAFDDFENSVPQSSQRRRKQILHLEPADSTVLTLATPEDILKARQTAMSHAVYGLLLHRFSESPGFRSSRYRFNTLMVELGCDRTFTSIVGTSPAALGNRIARKIIHFGINDGSNEQDNYAPTGYQPINAALDPTDTTTVQGIQDPNRWQPLEIPDFVDQSGNFLPGGSLDFVSPEWGNVIPFALDPNDDTAVDRYSRDDITYTVYEDPGPPPLLGDAEATTALYQSGFAMVARWSSHLDPSDGVMWDISPRSKGNSTLTVPIPTLEKVAEYYQYDDGGDWGTGYTVNPVTGNPYRPQSVARGDYTRVVAEYWADGLESETPPGHWITIYHYVVDHPEFQRRWRGQGEVLPALEWDVQSYLTLTGALHDAAIAAWSIKGWYDYVRPITALRYMANLGQSTDQNLPSYHPDGIPLIPGSIELVTNATTAPGERHEHLTNASVGKLVFRSWRGPDYIDDPETEAAGVGWILAENWLPYQFPTFVTPPFAGYVSGHSTFSRAGAVILATLTGTPYFPGGLGEFLCPQNEFLRFENGPSASDVRLQWATYYDASDESALSRIWGGIHPAADDLPGRRIGETIGHRAFRHAESFFFVTEEEIKDGSGSDNTNNNNNVNGDDDSSSVIFSIDCNWSFLLAIVVFVTNTVS